MTDTLKQIGDAVQRINQITDKWFEGAIQQPQQEAATQETSTGEALVRLEKSFDRLCIEIKRRKKGRINEDAIGMTLFSLTVFITGVNIGLLLAHLHVM